MNKEQLPENIEYIENGEPTSYKCKLCNVFLQENAIESHKCKKGILEGLFSKKPQKKKLEEKINKEPIKKVEKKEETKTEEEPPIPTEVIKGEQQMDKIKFQLSKKIINIIDKTDLKGEIESQAKKSTAKEIKDFLLRFQDERKEMIIIILDKTDFENKFKEYGV